MGLMVEMPLPVASAAIWETWWTPAGVRDDYSLQSAAYPLWLLLIMTGIPFTRHSRVIRVRANAPRGILKPIFGLFNPTQGSFVICFYIIQNTSKLERCCCKAPSHSVWYFWPRISIREHNVKAWNRLGIKDGQICSDVSKWFWSSLVLSLFFNVS